MPALTLATPRLLLRDLRFEDFEAIQAIDGDGEVQRYEGSARTRAQTNLFLGTAIACNNDQPRTSYYLAITRHEQVIGHLSLTMNNNSIREWEIGWAVRRVDWGQGYATEAASELVRFAFEQLEAHRIVAFCHYHNAASYRVMEKLGMQREGLLRETRRLNGAWADELLYGILETEFQ